MFESGKISLDDPNDTLFDFMLGKLKAYMTKSPFLHLKENFDLTWNNLKNSSKSKTHVDKRQFKVHCECTECGHKWSSVNGQAHLYFTSKIKYEDKKKFREI